MVAKRGKVPDYDDPAYAARRLARRRRQRFPFDNWLELSVQEMDDVQLYEAILDRLQGMTKEDVALWITHQRKKPGRPRGRRQRVLTLAVRARAVKWMREELRERKRRWRQENNRQRVTEPHINKLFDELIIEVGRAFPELANQRPIMLADVERRKK